MNWRKVVIINLLKFQNSKLLTNLDSILSLQFTAPENLKSYQNQKLTALLLYAYKNVPYYQRILTQYKVVQKNSVNLSNFVKLPILTKEIIAKEFEQLKSKKLDERKWHFNTSGGSTGSPVTFIQDEVYDEWNFANKIYYKTFVGQDIGDAELRLWGSERDLLMGKEKMQIRLRNFLYNRFELNAFKMSHENMLNYVELWNKRRPSWIEAYTQPIYEFARFIKLNNLKVHSPKGILASAGTLYPPMKELMEEVFNCPVFNRYGSRELGDMACSCEKNQGLHLSPWNHFFEILDKNNVAVSPGKTGRVVATTLNNFSMPLIRYEVGDLATRATKSKCTCGRTTDLIKSVEGRVMSVFYTKDGKVVPAEFFIHFVGVVYNKGFIDKFQIIQEDYDQILIKAVIKNQAEFKKYRARIEDSIRLVMGKCSITWKFVKQIPLMKSGKYLYTLSKVKNVRH